MRLFSAIATTCAATACLLLTACDQQPPEQSFDHDPRGLYAASISPNGKFIVTASIDHGVKLWDLENSQNLYEKQEEEQPLYSLSHPQEQNANVVAISPDNTVAISAQLGGVAVWDIAKGESKGFLPVAETIISAALSEQGKYLVLGLNNYRAKIYDLTNSNLVGVLPHKGAVRSVAITADGKHVLTGSNDNTAKLWDVAAKKAMHTWRHRSKVNFVALSPDKKYVLTCAGQKRSVLWNFDDGEKVFELPVSSKFADKFLPFYNLNISSVDFDVDRKLLAVGSPPRNIRIYDINSGKIIKHIVLPRKGFFKPTSAIVYAVAFSEDGNAVFAQASDGMAYKWNLDYQQ